MIEPDQCRAARILLGWSAADTAAAAKVGIATIKRFESGQPVQAGTVIAIGQAITAAGIELIAPGAKSSGGGAGVRLTEPSPTDERR
jgi:transcriptional regulator with XRE-family HTH domain